MMTSNPPSIKLPAKLLLSISIVSFFLAGCSHNMSRYHEQGAPDSDMSARTNLNSNKFDGYYGSPNSSADEDKLSPEQLRELKDREAARLEAERRARELQRKRDLANQLKMNAPKFYVVKKGDTLWDIAKVFLKDPTFWPEIWDKNQKIKNPHLIYPGDKLYIFDSKGNRLAWLRAKDGILDSVTEQVPTIKLSPSIRVERGDGSDFKDPIDAIKPFMAWPLIVDKEDISSAPYIVDARDAKLLIENGRTIYVRGLKNASPNATYGIYRTGKAIKDPAINRVIGNEINYNGTARITQTGNISTAVVEKALGPIRIGDRLIPIDTRPANLKFSITNPDVAIRGSVMALHDAHMISGQRMVAILNIGAQQGVRIGNVLGVYSPPRIAKDPYIRYEDRYVLDKPKLNVPISGKIPIDVEIPPERVGTMVVYHVADNYTYAVITESSHDVRQGYKIGNP